MDDKLPSVHETLSRALFSATPKGETQILSVRVEKELKEFAESKCAHYGITLSHFIRQCLRDIKEGYEA